MIHPLTQTTVAYWCRQVLVQIFIPLVGIYRYYSRSTLAPPRDTTIALPIGGIDSRWISIFYQPRRGNREYDDNHIEWAASTCILTVCAVRLSWPFLDLQPWYIVLLSPEALFTHQDEIGHPAPQTQPTRTLTGSIRGKRYCRYLPIAFHKGFVPTLMLVAAVVSKACCSVLPHARHKTKHHTNPRQLAPAACHADSLSSCFDGMRNGAKLLPTCSAGCSLRSSPATSWTSRRGHDILDAHNQ